MNSEDVMCAATAATIIMFRFTELRASSLLPLTYYLYPFPPVAQLDNAADSDSEDRGFESLRAGQKYDNWKLPYFIQSEGLVCNRRQAYVITKSVYVITIGVVSPTD